MATSTTTVLNGRDAVDYAAVAGVTLNKRADGIEDERNDVSLREAEEIAARDPSLIWVEVSLADPRSVLLIWCASDSDCKVEPDGVVQTKDSLSDFIGAWGQPTASGQVSSIRVYAWRRSDRPSLPKDVYVADDGGPIRFAYIAE
ncbi:MAG: hypothetical protein CMM50_07300 [Rhodospirillaceae bacterium]|nr:hypothetical protein [Rhodospirillaceae bacterium]